MTAAEAAEDDRCRLHSRSGKAKHRPKPTAMVDLDFVLYVLKFGETPERHQRCLLRRRNTWVYHVEALCFIGSKVVVLGKHIQNTQDSLKNIQQEQHFQTTGIYKLCTPNIYISSNLL